MKDNKFESFVDYLPTMFCAILILLSFLVIATKEREIRNLRDEQIRLERERISLLQKCNEALMEAKHPEYFQTKSE